MLPGSAFRTKAIVGADAWISVRILEISLLPRPSRVGSLPPRRHG